METGMDPRLAMGAAEQQDLAARSRMAENLAQSGGDDEAKRAKMRQACEGFESIFIQKMWEQMRATLPKEGLMKSKEEEFWMSMYDQELAKSIAGSGGIGLADMMMVQLDRTNASIGDAFAEQPLAADAAGCSSRSAASFFIGRSPFGKEWRNGFLFAERRGIKARRRLCRSCGSARGGKGFCRGLHL